MDHYKLSMNEKVKMLEKHLKREITELKNEVEEAEMLYGRNVRPICSVSMPLSAEYFAKQREITLKKMLDVSGVKPLKNQGLILLEEMEACLKSDITKESLPLLLHQFYLDRMQSLVQCKHLHMLRWQRFCEHTDTIERLYPSYRKRLDEIDDEYEDTKSRARRMSVAYHAHMLNKPITINSLRAEDVAIFFRWLIVQFHATKRFSAYLKILQWLPIIHRNNIDLQLASPVKPATEAEQTANDAKSSWKNMTAGLDFSYLPTVTTSSTRAFQRPNPLTVSSERAFSGFVSNEVTLGIPVHVLELPAFRDQLESLTTEYGISIRSELVSSADEMELFGAVNRRFKTLLNRQITCSTFYQYDNVPEGYEHWGIDAATHCLLKPSNWLKYIRIKPRNDPLQQRQMTHLKQDGYVDELLQAQNMFLKVTDSSQVTESLKLHAVAVRDPPTVQAISVSTHNQGTLKVNSVWKRIYESSEKPVKENADPNDDFSDVDNTSSNISRFGGHSRRKSYDYANTMQMLGLDEGDDSATQDPTVVQGAFLSFLHLRHLKIRDLRRQCKGILNYFRSVERTITIYDGGLSLENTNARSAENEVISEKKTKKKKGKASGNISRAFDNEKVNHAAGLRGPSRGIGSHHYVHNTPADFQIDQSQFMEFGGVENHDDFYTLDLDESERDVTDGVQGSGDANSEWPTSITAAAASSAASGAGSIPHVQDQRGYYIFYDAALADFRKLEQELLLIASQFIEKDTANRAVLRRSSAEQAQLRHQVPGEVDIASYGHREVDRFAVLIDMWTCELNFLINKQKLLDCYLEAYHHTFDPTERISLSQVMTDIIYQRPRYDFTQDYFVKTYRAECACLRLKTSLLSQILSGHIDECRHYLSRIARPLRMMGLPLHTITKQDITVNLPRPALKHVDMLEFHPTLGFLASRFLEAIRLAVNELRMIHEPSSRSESVALERQVLEHAQREWDGMGSIGGSYPSQIQRDIFSDIFVEDAFLMCEAVNTDILNVAGSNRVEESQVEAVEAWMRALETILLRHRLIEAAFETEVLARLYKEVASEMGFDECHMYLRLVQFEFANRKDKVDPHPSMMTTFIPDDVSADRYMPPQLLLAIQEMDENHLPKLSFRNREGVMQLLSKGGSLENLRMVLACQVAHKNSLATAINQFNNCNQWREVKATELDRSKSIGGDISDTRSNVSISTTLTQGTARSGTASPALGRRPQFGQALTAGKLKFGFDKQKKSPEAFISIQMEKMGPRDVVVNAFIQKKETQGMALRKEEEMVKLKRTLVGNFCKELSFRFSIHAMRAQIIACYSSLLCALEPFPSTRKHYFVIGRPNEKKREMDDVEGIVPNPQILQKRPRRVLSADGKSFLNLWFIPHFTEVLSSYRNLEYQAQEEIFRNWLEIASSLHDSVLYLCAYSRLGNAPFEERISNKYTVAADWGGAEGVGVQLSEIQHHIDALPMGTSAYTKVPRKVAEFLMLQKETLFLRFDAAIRYAVRETLLATDNIRAYNTISDNMHFALPALSNVMEKSITSMQMRLPEPLDPGAHSTGNLFPWLKFHASNGLHPNSYWEYWRDVEPCMQLCMAGLTATERRLANGEILGVDLLLQEVLKNGTIALNALEGASDDTPKGFLHLHHVGKLAESMPNTSGDDEKKKQSQSKPMVGDNDSDDVENKPKNKKEALDPTLPIDKSTHPIQAYKLINIFLRVWKQLEIFKLEWGKMKLHVKSIATSSHYKLLRQIFRSEIIVHVYTLLARQMGNLNEYNDMSFDDQPIFPPPNAPELGLRARTLIKLLEIFECKMISETRQQIGRELTLVLGERSREEGTLPTDLWHHPTAANSEGTARENFTVTRPHIVEDLLQGLMSDCSIDNGSVTFSKEHLNTCLSKLAQSVMLREKENYESYSVYYEKLLHHHHHLLYTKELEASVLKSSNIFTQGDESTVEAQFQLADRSHELVLEITALRAKIAEMREQSLTMDQDIRDEVRRDYQELVQNLFEVCFQLKSKLALCHLSIHEDVRSLIAETREEAMISLGKLKNETPTSTAEERSRTIQVKEEQVRSLQEERYELNILLNKLNTLHHWKRCTTNGHHKVLVEKLGQTVTKTRRDCLGRELVAKQETEILRAELRSARQSLKTSDDILRKTYKQIEREKRLQKEKEYKEVQEQRNRQQLASAKQRDMDRMLIELQEKDKRLKTLTHDVERNSLIEQTEHTKMQRNIKLMQSQLSLERNLKLDAFDRVDSLQAQVMDPERDSSFAVPSRPASAALSIAKSAVSHSVSRNSHSHSRRHTSFAMSPSPSVSKIRVRPLSSVATFLGKKGDTPMPKKRPQTAAGRLKSKIAAAILTEMDPPTDEHETVIELSRFTNG